MNRLLTLLATIVLLTSSSTLDRPRFMELNQKAAELRKQKDWKRLRAALIEIGGTMPAPTPRYFLRMASVEARLGNNPEAIAWLKKFAALGLRYDVAGDDDLKSLGADTNFAGVAGEMKAGAAPVQKA